MNAPNLERIKQQHQFAADYLLTILDKAPSLIAMTDRGGTLFYLNPTGRALLGLGEQEALSGLTLIDCQTPQARVRIAQEALPVAEREGVWCGDSTLLNRDGNEIKTYLTLIAHRDENMCLEGYCLMGRDMSDWVRTEEALRATQNQLWRLSAQHLTIQESERRRIATDLHDGLGQTLSLVKLSIEAAARSVSSGILGKAATSLEHLVPTMQSALAELRRISMNLRPSTLDDLGILATLSWYFREFEAACPHMKLEHDIDIAETDVPELLKISIFRIVQEATSNALKHARAERILVSLHAEDGALELEIADDGQGFDLTAMTSSHDFGKGLGLQSMMERAELSGGDYVFKSVPGQGTSIRVHWPAPEASKRNNLALMPQATVHLLRQQIPADRHLPERYSACLACMQRMTNE